MKRTSLFLVLFSLILLLASQGLAKSPEYKRVDLSTIPNPDLPVGGARADSITIYGGPGTLEGKFQTADMLPDRQGWVSEDLTDSGGGDGFWHIDDFNCADLDPDTPDNHAYWCGAYYEPCPAFPEDLAGGYTNLMNESMIWQTSIADPDAYININVTYSIKWDVEINFDFVYLQVFRATQGVWSTIATYTGLGIILEESKTFNMYPGDYIDDEIVRLRFLVISDQFVCGEDCGGDYVDYSSDGAAQIDNITVTFDQGSGPEQMGPTETCEPGEPENWNQIALISHVGDFAKVWPSLEEVEPGALNDTPRWAFIDDGEVVPELPGYTNGFDYGPGGFCVNAAGGLAGEGYYIHNMVRSPAIACPDGAFQDIIMTYDMFRHQMMADEGTPVFYKFEVRSTADPTGESGWTPWINPSGFLYYGGPAFSRMSLSIGESLLPNCTFLQVSFGVQQADWWGPPNPFSSPAPYFDNVRVQYIPVESAIPEMISEPLYTQGTTNSVFWTDTSGAGSVDYYAECATDPDFASLVANSGWTPELTYEFSDLAHNQIYYYRVKSRDAESVESEWSGSVFSTQDSVAPLSNVDEMPEYSWYFPLPIPYSSSDDGSGLFQIQLFYNFNGGPYQSAGIFPYPTPEPWLDFYFPDGDGEYGFYTVAIDAAGNEEPIPNDPPDESIIHDLTPPEIPTMTVEPEFTPGLVNSVFWSDESASGGNVTVVQRATAPDFNSGLITLSTLDLTWEFIDLADGQIYYFRAASRDEASNQSDWSVAVFSTQDATAPVSSADEQPPEQNSLTFDVPYTATDATSGVASVHLMFRHDNGEWTSYGDFTETPISFTAAGDGVYRFLTVATDVVGNVEAGPDVADAMTTVITSASNPPTLVAEPEFTIGTANAVTWSDESASGAVGYYAECATDVDFTTITAVSDWIVELTFEFPDLADNQIYYYRVMSRNGFEAESDWSASVFSTQDATPPVSSADGLPTVQADLEFDVAFTANDATSGMAYLELFFSVDGGEYDNFGSFTESPIAFIAAGDGDFAFYTVATDAVGNVEEAPDTPDAVTTVDTSASNPPTLVAEPEFTIGTTNTVFWSDESGSGAVAYYAECATDAEFSTVVALSDWIPDFTFDFIDLVDNQIYYYRVMSRDGSDNESGWSAPVFSTQDATAPVSNADELPPMQGALEFDVPFTVEDATSGVAYLELFFNIDGGDFTSFGAFTESPVAFTAAGDGVYAFYTVATDAVGNIELVPDTPDATTTIDTSVANPPVLVAEPEFTQGTSNTVTWSDESGSGAVAYFAECSTDPEFTAVVASSDWIPELAFEFTDLSDAQIYFFRVMSRTEMNNESGWSAAVSSTQDATAPMSNVQELPATQDALIFDVPFIASDATSGVASVELFFNLDGGDYNTFGAFTESPIAFTASSDGVYGFYTMASDAVGNLEAIPDTPPDASTTVETSSLAGTFAIAGGAANTSTLAVQLNSDVTSAVQMRFTNDNAVWPEEWLVYAPEHDWLLAEGPDGTRTVYAQYQDGAQEILELSDTIEYDGSLPEAVSGITVVRGHNLVEVSWNHDRDDAAGFVVYRGLWYEDTPGISAYPFYGTLTGDVIPTRPIDHDGIIASEEWELAGSVDAGVLTFTDTWPDSDSRGIYFYEVFAVDVADNYSLPAETNHRATNYILGDVMHRDGNVNLADVGVLATSYGQTTNPNRCNPEPDVGPTDNSSSSGIPLPDNFIDFEDLMIFSLNYGYESDEPTGPGKDTVYLSWVQLAENSYSLRLTQPCPGLKGLNLSVDLPDAMVAGISGGSLLEQQDGFVFLENIEAHGLDVGLSLMGTGIDFIGTGELFRVTLPVQDCQLDDVAIVVRDVNNNDMDFEMDQLSDVPLALGFSLGNNYPNPFNPMTTIEFSLPATQLVRLSIYSIDGRLITNLVNEQYSAGRHVVVWKGRNGQGQTVASGTYFYRINAGSFSETHKMVLTK